MQAKLVLASAHGRVTRAQRDQHFPARVQHKRIDLVSLERRGQHVGRVLKRLTKAGAAHFTQLLEQIQDPT